MTGGSPGHALLDHVPEMVTISDREGRIVYANPATERVSGYAPEEFQSLDPFERMHPEDRPRCEEAFGELLRNPGLSLQIEHRIRHKDGTWRWVEGTFASLFEDPEVEGLLATVRDVTEGKRAEERQAFLLELNDAIRPLSDPVGIQGAATRLLGERLDVDRCFYFEGDPEAGQYVVHRDYLRGGATSIAGSFAVEDWPLMGEAFASGEPLVISDVATTPLVSTKERAGVEARDIRALIVVSLVKQGRFVAALVVAQAEPRAWTHREVTLVGEVAERTWAAVERARTEEALRASEEKYRTLFESIDEGFCIVEVIFDENDEPVDYRFLDVNPAFERHTGLRDAAGKRMRELEPRHEEHWFETYGRIALTGEPERFQNAAEHLDCRFYDVYAFRVGVPQERKVAILFTDITRRREAEDERLRLRDLEASARAEASERERIGRELHDRVAHTMGVAHQSLQLHAAYAQSDPTRAAEKLNLATEATKTALDQTRDLSTQLARRGTEETRDGLGAALRDLLDTHVPPGVEAKLSVADESSVPPPTAEQAYLVMREAVRNALAHSGCTRIEVSLEVDDAGLRGRVEDDGSGFDPHGGGRDDRTDGGPATGVGLRSMRERMELLGGRLDVSSEPGRGTAVEMRAPLVDSAGEPDL
jgi:PAS domain S-box-containing protein